MNPAFDPKQGGGEVGVLSSLYSLTVFQQIRKLPFWCSYNINYNKQDNKHVYICICQDSFLYTEVSIHRSVKNLLK